MAKGSVSETIKQRVRRLAKASSELSERSSQLANTSRQLMADAAQSRTQRAVDKASRKRKTEGIPHLRVIGDGI